MRTEHKITTIFTLPSGLEIHLTNAAAIDIEWLKNCGQLQQAQAELAVAKAALEQEERHTTELCQELAEARAEIDKTYKTWCGRDYMHLPLSTAMGSVVAQARQEAASECIEAIEYEHGILGLAFTLRQRFGLDDE